MSRKDAVRALEVGADPAEPRSPPRRARPRARRALVDAAHGGRSRRRGRRRATFAADVVLIATGSTPFRPPRHPVRRTRDVDDSDAILQTRSAARALVVLGGGVIGCEYACMFAALGVQVTLVERAHRLLPFLDAEMGERLRGRDGGARRRRSRSRSAARSRLASRRRAIVLELDARAREIEAEKCSFAAGRAGNTRRPRPRGVGVELDERGCVDGRRALPDRGRRTSTRPAT